MILFYYHVHQSLWLYCINYICYISMLPNVSAIYRDLAFMADPTLQQRTSNQAFSQPVEGFLQ